MTAMESQHGSRWLRSAVIATAALTLLSAAPTAAAGTTPYGTNLVKNPGAESGTASSDGNAVVPIPSWETFAGATVVRYGQSGGFPSHGEGNRINGGGKFFSAGVLPSGSDQCGDLQQTITLKGRGSVMDNGHVKVTFQGQVATDSEDRAHFDLYFRNSQNHSVAFNGIERSTSATNNTFRTLKGSRILPKQTRLLRVHLWASDIGGSYCNAYFDKISVVLTYVP